jgi:hypothetical protein
MRIEGSRELVDFSYLDAWPQVTSQGLVDDNAARVDMPNVGSAAFSPLDIKLSQDTSSLSNNIITQSTLSGVNVMPRTKKRKVEVGFCYSFVNRGRCTNGPNCIYSHDAPFSLSASTLRQNLTLAEAEAEVEGSI